MNIKSVLTDNEVAELLKEIAEYGEIKIGTESYQKLYNFFLSNGEMPYGIAKARTGDPTQWISNRLIDLYVFNQKNKSLK